MGESWELEFPSFPLLQVRVSHAHGFMGHINGLLAQASRVFTARRQNLLPHTRPLFELGAAFAHRFKKPVDSRSQFFLHLHVTDAPGHVALLEIGYLDRKSVV